MGVGSGITMVAGVVFTAVASRNLSKFDYGTYRQTFLIYDFIAPVLLLGLPSSLYFLLSTSKEKAKGVLIDSLALIAIGGAIFGTVLFFFEKPIAEQLFGNPDLRKSIRYMSVYPLLILPTMIVPVVLIIANQSKYLALYTLLTTLLSTLGGIMAVFLWKSYINLVLVKIFFAGLFIIPSLIITFKNIEGRFRLPCLSSMRTIINYSIPIGLATMLGAITLQVHSLIVSTLSTTEQYSIYINGAMEIPLISVITGSITTIILAEMSGLIANGKINEALNLFNESAFVSAKILFPTMIFFLVAAEPFIVMIYSKDYLESVTPFIIYLFIVPSRVVTYGSALIALGFSKVILIRSIIDLIINTVLCLVFVHYIGVNGAAISLIVSMYCWTVPYNISKIAFGFKVKWTKVLPFRKLGKVFLKSCISSIAPYIVFKFSLLNNEYQNFILALTSFIILYGLLNIKEISKLKTSSDGSI